MDVTLICGRAGSGKTAAVIDAIRGALARGLTCYYLVPQQATLSCERYLCKQLGGLWGVEVISPQRLCKRVLQTAGQPQKTLLDAQGARLLLARAALDCAGELKLYGGSAYKVGFVDDCLATLRHAKAHALAPDDLLQVSESLSEGLLAARLHDTAVLYREMEANTAAVGGWDALDEVDCAIAAMIANPGVLGGSAVFIEEWDAGTPQMLNLLTSLLRSCAMGVVSLRLSPHRDIDADPFVVGQEIKAHILRELPGAVDVINLPDALEETALRHVERQLFAPNPMRYEGKPEALRLYVFPDAQQECRAVAAGIVGLIEQGKTWGEICVAFADEAYLPVLGRVMQEAGIPFFVDGPADSLTHPLMRMVLQWLTAAAQGLPAMACIGAMKNGLWPLANPEVIGGEETWPQDYHRAVMDMQTYLAHRGLTGARAWQREWEHPGSGEYDMERLNALRMAFGGALLWAQEALTKPVGAFAEQMAARLEGMSPQLELLRQQLLQMGEDGRLPQGAAQAQAAQVPRATEVLAGALEQMAAYLPEASLPPRDLVRLLQAGLAGSGLGAVPPRVDEVLIARVGYSVVPAVTQLFLVGASESALQPAATPGLFSLDDTARMPGIGKGMAPGAQSAQAKHDAAIYRLCSGTQGLWLSYALRAGGSLHRPSGLMLALREMFGGKEGRLPIRQGRLPQTLDWHQEALAVAGMPEDIDQRAADLRRADPERFDRWVQAMDLPMAVDPAHAALLLRERVISTSRLETYAKCSWRYFVQYGLRPERERLARPDGAAIGSLLHEALSKLVGKQIADDPAEVSVVLEQVFADKAPHLRQTAHGRALCARLDGVLREAVAAVNEQTRHTAFRPVLVEARFGANAKLGALQLGDSGVRVEGIFDRIDAAHIGGQDHLVVVDYKTSASAVNDAKRERGQQVQMYLYMAAALEAWPKAFGWAAVPAGMALQGICPNWGDDAAKSRQLDFRWQGRFAAKDEVLQLLDDSFIPGREMQVLPLTPTEKGTLPGRAACTAEQLRELTNAVVGQANEQVKHMLAGEAAPAADPADCTYCDHRAGCLVRGGRRT